MLRSVEDMIKKVRTFATPGAPGKGIEKLKEGEEQMSEKQQETYRSIVVTLLYLTKHSRPDISNSVRELSKAMQKGSPTHFKAMMRVVKYIKDTRHMGISLRPKVKANDTWSLTCYCDSDWGGDLDSRRSVTGWEIFIGSCLVSWGSRSQKLVTLSSSEAEYVAVSEVAREVLHVKNILEFMNVEMKYPITILCDNVGAIYLSNNCETRRTKHIDLKYHFVREFVEDGVLKVVFVRSSENLSDPFTKNVGESDHVSKFQYMKNYELGLRGQGRVSK